MPVKLLPHFVDQYNKLPKVIQDKVGKALGLLDENFRHPRLRNHPVKGFPGIFEAYVVDKYRVTFERQGDLFVMRNVDNHDECLREA
jgi:hypothetical protein